MVVAVWQSEAAGRGRASKALLPAPIAVSRATVAYRECMAADDYSARHDWPPETIHRDGVEFAAIKRRAPSGVAELISRRRGSATGRCRLSTALMRGFLPAASHSDSSRSRPSPVAAP